MRSRCSLIVVIAGSFLAGSVSPAGAIGGFGDVGATDFYSSPVQWMVDNDITDGTSPGCFSPSTPTTRAEVATFLHRVEGEPSGGSENFIDVGPSDYFAGAVGWMVDAGITTGTTPSTFEPSRLVTRGEVATFLYRAAGSPSGSLSMFVDVPESAFYAEAVAWMLAEGITTGTTPSTFEPNRYVTRGEVATFLYRSVGSPPVALSPSGVCNGASVNVDLIVAEAISFTRLNELRTGLGLAPLVRLPSMDSFARNWSETMDMTGRFEHSGGPYGENIAWWSRGSATPEAAAATMHDLWVTSPGHYANMTDPSYSVVGVGFWQSDDGGWHATHVFQY